MKQAVEEIALLTETDRSQKKNAASTQPIKETLSAAKFLYFSKLLPPSKDFVSRLNDFTELNLDSWGGNAPSTSIIC